MLFEIELTKVEPPEAAFNQTVEEFVAKLEKRRVEGNTIFKQGNYERAMIVYQKYEIVLISTCTSSLQSLACYSESSRDWNLSTW
jgi:hypothetical protein